jgi:threonine aldolase
MLISGQGSIRLVTHLDIDRADIDRFAAAVRDFLSSAAKAA